MIAGRGFTVTVVVAAAPAQPSVFTPFTVYTVVEVGVAVGFAQVVHERPLAGLHTYAAPPVACRFTLPFGHIACGALATTMGNCETFTVTVSVLTHPLKVVPVTVYTVVVDGEAVGLAQVVQLRPVAGLHT